MSASTLVTIMCDGPSCGAWVDEGIADTAAQARKQLRSLGKVRVFDANQGEYISTWRVGLLGGADLCPKCSYGATIVERELTL